MKKIVALALLSAALTSGYLNAMQAVQAKRLNAEQFVTLQSLITDEHLKDFVTETVGRFEDEYADGMPDIMWPNLDGDALQWIVSHVDAIKDSANYRSMDSLVDDLHMMILQNRIHKRSMKDIGNIAYAASFLGIQPILDAFRRIFENPTLISAELLELAFQYKDIVFGNYSQLLISVAGRSDYCYPKEEKFAIVKLLLDPRLKVDRAASDKHGNTALSRAVEMKDTDLVKLLIDGGVNPSLRGVCEGPRQSAPVWYAYYNRDSTMMYLLIDRGADVNATDSRGATLLMAAISDGMTVFVPHLLYRGIDVNAQDNDKCTALMRAAGKGDAQSVEAILEQGVKDIDVKDQWGDTALVKAVRFGTTAVVQLLLEAKADATIMSGEQTLLDIALAKASEHVEARAGMVELLKTHLAK